MRNYSKSIKITIKKQVFELQILAFCRGKIPIKVGILQLYWNFL